MSKFLITGGAGFIGTNLIRYFLEQGHSAVSFDNYSAGKKLERFQSGAEYIEGDIRDLEALKRVCAMGIDGIMHLAALPRVPFSIEYPLESNDVNVNGTLNVLLAARDCGVKRVVFATSSAAFGDQAVFPIKEDGVLKKPLSPYALQKLIGEEYCRLFSELYGLKTLSLCFYNIYGSFMDPDGAYALVIGRFLKAKKEGKPLTIRGDGEMARDYTHAYDVARAVLLALTKDTVGQGEVVNIGCGQPYSVNQVAALIGGQTVFVPALPGEVRLTLADNSKAKRLLGWEPTLNLEDGITELKKEYGVG